MFTLDTETGFRDVVLINASYGLGEPIVQGSVTPDEYCVFKPTLKRGLRPILQKTVGTKEFKLIGLCGQAPSDYPDFAKFLVECGIDSISLNPDAVLTTTRLVANAEKELRTVREISTASVVGTPVAC